MSDLTPDVRMRSWDWVESSFCRWRETNEPKKPRDPPADDGETIFDPHPPSAK